VGFDAFPPELVTFPQAERNSDLNQWNFVFVTASILRCILGSKQ